jgi:hypothetical protein
MSATRQLDQAAAAHRRLHDRSSWRIVGQTHIPYRVRESEQIIGSRFRLLLDGESDHFPAARRREGLRMLLAEVVAMWLGLVGERTEDRCGVSVGIRQRRGSGTLAACSGTAARPHLPDATPGGGSIVGSAAVSDYSSNVPSHRRDRHGRGLRGPLALPNALTVHRAQPPHPASKADFFSEAVRDAVDRVGLQCPDVLVGITVGIEDVPHFGMAWSQDEVPLAAALEATATQPGQVVIYRRPLEHRAVSRRGLRILVYRTIVEQLSALTGRSVEDIDPYDAGAEDE